jgi:hypothetical protein
MNAKIEILSSTVNAEGDLGAKVNTKTLQSLYLWSIARFKQKDEARSLVFL